MIKQERLEQALKFLSETDEQHAKLIAGVDYLKDLAKNMKGKFIVYATKPSYTEVIVDADTEEQALEKVKNLKSEELEWRDYALKKERVTYEVFIKSDKDSTE